jgi:hypothetical protein
MYFTLEEPHDMFYEIKNSRGNFIFMKLIGKWLVGPIENTFK